MGIASKVSLGNIHAVLLSIVDTVDLRATEQSRHTHMLLPNSAGANHNQIMARRWTPIEVLISFRYMLLTRRVFKEAKSRFTGYRLIAF